MWKINNVNYSALRSGIASPLPFNLGGLRNLFEAEEIQFQLLSIGVKTLAPSTFYLVKPSFPASSHHAVRKREQPHGKIDVLLDKPLGPALSWQH